MSDTPYPRHPTRPEQRAIIVPSSERNVDRAAPTLTPCPWCVGVGMVSVEIRGRWLSIYPELRAEPGAAVVDDTEDPPTTCEPVEDP